MPHNRDGALGFSLVDMMMAIAVGAIVLAVALPPATRTINALHLNAAARNVERELQLARMKAVSTNRSLRVRFNCPAAGQFRTVEVMNNTTIDTPAGRCSLDSYPYPGPSDSDPTTPTADGPLRILPAKIAVNTMEIQFSPRGTASTVSGGTVTPITTAVNVLVSPVGDKSIVEAIPTNPGKIEINAFGKVRLH